MRLSIVTTLYMSEPYLLEFHRRVRSAAETITSDLELIFVDDGSPDGSLNLAVSLLSKDPDLRVIALSRNFGHHKAIMTGLAHATGDLVFLIDSDLEEDPELLELFYERLTHTGADVVYGQQTKRRGGWWGNLAAKVYYRAFALLCSTALPENVLTVRLMKDVYVHNLVLHREHEISLAGLWQITGFHQIPVFVDKRAKGSSTYTLARKIEAVVNAVTSFSNKPLVFIFYLGALILTLSSLAGGYLVVARIFYKSLLWGWPSLIVSIWMLGGLTIFCLGLIGIYLSKVFIETKGRPYTIIRKIYTAYPEVGAREPKDRSFSSTL
jgi:putative glycosyltransferase